MGRTYPGPLTRELVRLGAPIILSNLAYTLLGAVDTFLMGRVGTVALGAVGLASMTFLTASLVLRGTAGGSMPFVSRMYGAGNLRMAGRYLKYFLFLALLISPVALLFPTLIRVFFSLTQPDPQVASQALIYIHIRLWEIPFTMINSVLIGFLIGMGNSRLPMTLTWLAVGFNVLVSSLLVFGLFGLPAMGIAGAALGTVLAVILQTLLGLYLVYRLYGKTCSLRKWEWAKVSDLGSMLKVGLPMGLTEGMELGAFTTFFALISRLGAAELAASQIANQIGALAFMLGFALSSATGSLVGRFMGAGQMALARSAGFRGVLLGAGLMGLIGLGFLTIPRILVTPFATEVAVLEMGVRLLRIMAFYQIFDAMNIIFRGALNGAGDTRFTMGVTALGAWGIFIPGVYLAAFRWEWGLAGAWVGAISYIVVLGAVFFFRFRSGSWQRIQLGERVSTVQV